MEADLRVLSNLKNQIEKSYINFKKSPKERINFHYLETRLQKLEIDFQNFQKKDEQLILTYDQDVLLSTSYMENDYSELVSNTYLDYKTDLKTMMAKLRSPVESCSETNGREYKNVSKINLPKIKIPSFSGMYSDWTSFKDIFLSLIHNNPDIDDVQKLHYLKTQVAGEAEQLIKHIPITELNYLKCWELLTSRYDNKKYMSNCILKRLFNQRGMAIESAQALKNLADTTSNCLHELTNLGLDVNTWDVIIIFIVSSKLDAESRKQWELQTSRSSCELPTFKEFKEFLEVRARALEFIEPKGKSRPQSSNVFLASTSLCPVCSESHTISHCKKFKESNVDERRLTVESLRLCFNCLGGGHSVRFCRVPTMCHICRRKHHTLLHAQTNDDAITAAQVTSREESQQVHNISGAELEPEARIESHYASGIRRRTLLATALVRAQAIDGTYHLLKALIDQGSQASFISESAVQLLRLRKTGSRGLITGIGGEGILSKHKVLLNIQSRSNSCFEVKVSAHVLGTLTTILPESKFVLYWPELQGIELADPSYNSPGKIDLILGAEIYCHILTEGILKGPRGTPVAQNTRLGWILSGPVIDEQNPMPTDNVIGFHAQVKDTEMQNLLKQFWELESDQVLNNKAALTPEEQSCETIFNETVRRDKEGRYIVHLPFRDEDPQCKYGNSRAIAIRRLNLLERKFTKDPNFKKRYSEVINEYIELGHMVKVIEDRKKEDSVYLPHHAVIREDKLTTKLRVVFDASCKGSNAVSLNDTLMVGPTLQADLRHTLMKWRTHPICLAADVIKMYRQVKVDLKHTDFQRIVWRDDPGDEIAEYKLTRVTFGTASAPYLAVKTLQQTALDEGTAYPEAAGRVLNDFYVDDLMTGAESETEALMLYDEIKQLLGKGGFSLQKWTSNDKRVLKKLNESEDRNIKLKTDDITKILGLTWNRSYDEFGYTVSMTPTTGPETKRTVISFISKLYDPLGWLSPCIITSKIFIQKLWLARIDWDDELDQPLLQEWKNFRNELHHLTKFTIPRWIHKSSNDIIIELHGFSDASAAAYAAVVYLRIIDDKQKIYSHLLTSKTKVAPIKQISIPRLELCGALLLSKLMTEVSNLLRIPKTNLRAWTDSTVVLSWLSDHPSRWKTFVGNRTSEILNSLDSWQWSHVQSKDNPADCASRGMPPLELVNNKLWKEGPTWLRGVEITYPKQNITRTKLEKRSIKVYATNVNNEDFADRLFSMFSSLRKLVRVVAFCRRFLDKGKRTTSRETLPAYLKASEIRNSLDVCIELCQERHLCEVVRDCKLGKINKKSNISSLNPFLDDKGLIRVGGRIHKSLLSENAKHPLIIPHENQLTRLIVADAHERTFHGGQQLTLNFILSKYWIIKAKKLVRAHIHSCVTCIRYKARGMNQLMGQLPSCRVTPAKPFLHSGVDYAGPISIRVSKGRGNKSYKGYICLFVCMVTRAVHIEPVSDMTCQAFLAAYKRFVSRRGHCAHVWSDNGTTFVGAAKELQVLFLKELSNITREIASALAINGTEWHFIPPHAPNFGGLWEAGIKSTKHHIKRVIGDATLTYEELATVLAQVESCLNSRPISKASSDPDDLEPLTPGHFLVGQPLVVPPDYNYESENPSCMTSLRRWQLTQRITQCFWRRWSREYLTMLFQRHKWATPSKEPQIGQIVLVMEDNLPPARWLVGQIMDLHSGKDGHTRVVTLRYKGGLIKRPTSKLCPLPLT